MDGLTVEFGAHLVEFAVDLGEDALYFGAGLGLFLDLVAELVVVGLELPELRGQGVLGLQKRM